MKKRVVCAFLGLVMMVSQSFTVFADTESDIRQQKAQAESQLSQTNDTIASLSEQQHQIQQRRICCRNTANAPVFLPE